MVSVVIPARNAEPWLCHQLNALATQLVEGDWEVILADNGSTDGTVRTFEEFAGRLPSARIVDASALPGQSYARNLGAKEVRGDALVFLDADDVVAPGYVQAMRLGLAECDVGIARLDYATLNVSDSRGMQAVGSADDLAPYLGFLPAGPGAGLAVWREVFVQLDGFDVDMPPGEDLDFCWRAQLAGFVLARIPDAVLMYRNRIGSRRLFEQAFRYGAVHPELYRRFRGAGMPRRSGWDALRFYGGLFRELVRVRNRHDASTLAVMGGLRLGHLVGTWRTRTWYP